MITRQIKSQGQEILAKIKSVDETTKAKIAKIDNIEKDVAEIKTMILNMSEKK